MVMAVGPLEVDITLLARLVILCMQVTLPMRKLSPTLLPQTMLVLLAIPPTKMAICSLVATIYGPDNALSIVASIVDVVATLRIADTVSSDSPTHHIQNWHSDLWYDHVVLPDS